MDVMSKTYECGNCGASTDLPAEQISTMCAFCESPLVLSPDSIEGPAPELVAPFIISKEMALQKLATHLKQQWLAPDALRRAVSPSRVRAIQVPFFMFDAKARSRYSAEVGINWTETYTDTEMDSEGNVQTVTRTRTHTEWFSREGTHVYEYRKHLVCGSQGIEEKDTNYIEPFDIGKAIPFSPELLAGVISERFTVSKEKAEQICVEELEQSEKQNLSSFLPGDSSRAIRCTTEVTIKNNATILLPIYVASYKHDGKTIHLLVNGQSAQVGGDVPRSKTKIALLIAWIIIFVLSSCCCVGVMT